MKLTEKLWMCNLCFTLLMITCKASIQITADGGYKNIDIAISSTVNINRGIGLLKNIKILLKGTSERLQLATHNHFYFKSATISIPNEWYDIARMENGLEKPQLYEEAQVKVVGYSKQPLIATERQNECGKPGEYIQISEKFFTQGNQRNEMQELKFLQNWAALRFGIFEEDGMSNSKVFPQFYQTETGWKLTSCDHPEHWTLDTNKECGKSTPDICQLTRANDNTQNSSIMSSNWELYKNMPNAVPKKKYFCSSNDDSLHNIGAPTPQNTFCKRKSTWDIITESEDYKAVRNPTESRAEPTITIVRRTQIPSVIIVDPKLCGKTFYENSVAVRSVAKFLRDNKHKMNIMINDELVDHPTDPSSTAFIAKCGAFPSDVQINLANALDKAKSFGMVNVIYVANGGTDYDSDVITFLQENLHSHVHIISYPPRQKKLPTDLQKYHFFLHNINSVQSKQSDCNVRARVEFDEVFNSIIQHFNDDKEKILVTTPIISREKIDGTLSIPFRGNIFATVYFCDENQFSSKVELNGQGLADVTSAGLAMQTVVPVTALPGVNVYYSLTPGEVHPDNYALTFWIENDGEYVEFESSILKESELPLQNNSMPPRLKIATNIDIPLVVAKITDLENEANTKIVTLRKLFTEESYSVFKNTYIHSFVQLAESPTTYRVEFIASDNIDSSVAKYTMQSFATFSSKLTSRDVLNFPPRRILDFRVNETNSEAKTATFVWTAPGARFDDDTASAYYIRCGHTHEEYNIEDYSKLSLKPSEPGTEENFTIGAHASYNIHHCTLRAEGAPGIISESSNTATFYMHTDTEMFSVGATIGIAVGVTLLVIVILVVAFFLVYRRMKNQQRQKKFQKRVSVRSRTIGDPEPIITIEPLLPQKPPRLTSVETQNVQQEQLQNDDIPLDANKAPAEMKDKDKNLAEKKDKDKESAEEKDKDEVSKKSQTPIINYNDETVDYKGIRQGDVNDDVTADNEERSC